MRITTVGRGTIGSGLAELWERAGHEVTQLGHEGGDVSDAKVVLLAMPGAVIVEALDGVEGIDGKLVIDATNLIGVKPPAGFASNTEYVKSRCGGPTVKSFNVNFGNLYGHLGTPGLKPSNLWCGDDEVREEVEGLIRDACFEPVYAGPLENTALLEGVLPLFFAIKDAEMGNFFYRIASPSEL